MDVNSWAEIGQLFDELIQMSPADREARVRQINGQNPGLATELQSLIQAHDNVGDFFEDKIPALFASVAPTIDLQTGDQILHFQILEVLGEGSIAKVFLAQDLELGRRVALKICFSENKEARTLAHFNLDGIVHVYSEYVTTHRDLPVRIMCLQYVAGPTLGKLCAAVGSHPSLIAVLDSMNVRDVAFEPQALQWREQLAAVDVTEGFVLLGVRIAEILSLAHARDVLHLDIKPANILIDPYGRPFLSDFNVSTLASSLHQGEMQHLGGTPAFMAPEHKRFFENPTLESARVLGPASDVFSLAVVLRQTITRCGVLDRELEGIFDRALAADLNERTPSAKTFAQQLGSWLRRRQAEKELPAMGSGFAWIRRHPMWAMFSLTVASQVFASIINITYNQIQIVSSLTTEQNAVFMKFVGIYNLITYPTALLLTIYSLRSLVFGTDDIGRSRLSALRIPWVVAIAIAAGWLPGAWIFPRVIDHFAGPLDPAIYWQFGISFSLGWLISMTTSMTVIVTILMRSVYPSYWQGDPRSAALELRPVARLNRSLTFASALVPMAGVLLLLMMAPVGFSASDDRAFKILLVVTVGFGLFNLLLAQRLTQIVEDCLEAFRKPRPFDGRNF